MRKAIQAVSPRFVREKQLLAEELPFSASTSGMMSPTALAIPVHFGLTAPTESRGLQKNDLLSFFKCQATLQEKSHCRRRKAQPAGNSIGAGSRSAHRCNPLSIQPNPLWRKFGFGRQELRRKPHARGWSIAAQEKCHEGI